MDPKPKAIKSKAVKIKLATLARLDKVKHKGQSNDGVITELLDFYEKKGRKSEM